MSGDRPCPPDPYRTADGWHIIPPPDPAVLVPRLLVLLDELSVAEHPAGSASTGRTSAVNYDDYDPYDAGPTYGCTYSQQCTCHGCYAQFQTHDEAKHHHHQRAHEMHERHQLAALDVLDHEPPVDVPAEVAGLLELRDELEE